MRITVQDVRLEGLQESSALRSGLNLPGFHRSAVRVSEGFGTIGGDRNAIGASRSAASTDRVKEATGHGGQEEG
ncbi:hypothetical protein [Gorillibacterium sp. sgz500922]|uniref:hypothetical protein n=1 Tax=Gorillibacterium sp. sgz500922 TaxID=3446694 RepID=UPI003F678BA2